MRVFIAEGEKAVDALRSLRLVATTNPMGAGKWKPEWARFLAKKQVIILPDNDDVGKKHALAVAKSLVGIAQSVRVVELPGLPDKGDVADWVQSGGDREALLALVVAARPMDDVSLEKLRLGWEGSMPQKSARGQFEVNAEGVFARTGETGEVWICSPVEVIALVRDFNGEGWGLRLRWKDLEDVPHEWTMPFRMLAADASAVRARLLSGGVRISAAPKVRELLTEFLQTARPDRLCRCVEKIGWNGDTYVLPDGSISAPGADQVFYQFPLTEKHAWNERGTLEEWRRRVGRLCTHNSRLVGVVSCAFAGPLLSLVGAGNGGFHLQGTTSIGKSTALLVGASVCGGGGDSGFVQSWRTTINGLEVVAEAHNDSTLFLDEISQCDPERVASTAYLLGNGRGKARMSETDGLRRQKCFRLIWVSAGETSLSQHAASVGNRTRGGAEVRLLNVRADAGEGMGLFEDLHGASSGDQFANRLGEASLECYGTPLRNFIQRVVRHKEAVTRCVRREVARFAARMVKDGAPGEVRRAAERFALLGVAGELATHWGITGWRRGEAKKASRRLFRSWLASRGTDGSFDMKCALDQVCRMVKEQLNQMPVLNHDCDLSDSGSQHNVIGFRREKPQQKTEFLFHPDYFRNQLCRGFMWQDVARELDRLGHLKRELRHFTVNVRMPKSPTTTRMFCVYDSILDGSD
jgi:uncharacterized protein (DUF927 family)